MMVWMWYLFVDVSVLPTCFFFGVLPCLVVMNVFCCLTGMWLRSVFVCVRCIWEKCCVLYVVVVTLVF
jgi:hypothetical protein